MSVRDLEVGGEDPGGEVEQPGQFRPRPDVPAWPLTIPIDWTADPFKDKNWQAQLHSLRMTNSVLSRYEKTGDSRHYHEAAAIVLDWWRFHQTAEHVPRLVWEGMRAGVRAVHVAYVLDRVLSGREQLAPEAEATLLEMAQTHVARLSNRKSLVVSNHGLFQIRGLMVLCQVLGESSGCKGTKPLIDKQLRALLNAQFTKSGVHREQSPTYHLLAIAAFESLAPPGGVGVNRHIADRLVRARAIAPWFAFPGGRMAALGDSEGTGPQEPPSERQCKFDSAAGCVEVAGFTQAGYAVVRSPWSEEVQNAFMLIMTGSYSTKMHKHADDLGFELMDRGQMLFVDVGKFAYQPGRMREFATSRRAHNTVGLANQEIYPNASKFQPTALEPTEVADEVHTLRGHIDYPGLFVQSRRVDYAPGRYLLISDDLRSNSLKQYESYLHLAPQLSPKREGSAFTVPLQHGQQMRIESLAPDCVGKVERGLETPERIQGWVTEEYGKMAPASALTFTCAGKNRNITLLVSFDAAARRTAISRHTKRAP